MAMCQPGRFLITRFNNHSSNRAYLAQLSRNLTTFFHQLINKISLFMTENLISQTPVCIYTSNHCTSVTLNDWFIVNVVKVF